MPQPLIYALLAAGAMLLPPASAGTTAGPAVQPQDQPTEQTSRLIEKFRTRLESLTPANPEDYFLLGEEIADQANDAPSRRLVEELYVLAFELSADRPGRNAVQAGACLALADFVRGDHDRRWLVALARTLDPRRIPPEWLGRQAPATTDSAAYQVATVLGLVRSGDGGQARQLLDRPEVKSALEAYDRMMTNMGITGGANGIVREAGRWPCPECQNARFVTKGNPPEARVCSTCNGDPGPSLTGAEFIAQLRFESLILQGAQRSWSAQIAADSGAPLLDPDAAGLAPAFDVNTTLVLWRNGHWVIDPSAPLRPKPPAPVPPKPKTPPVGPVTTTPTTPP